MMLVWNQGAILKRMENMAGLSRIKSGGWLIQFPGLDGKRQFVRLGPEVAARAVASLWRDRINVMVADRDQGREHDAATVRWLENLHEKYLRKLRAVGLADRHAHSVADLTNRYLDSLPPDYSKNTRLFYDRIIKKLHTYFGAGRLVAGIKPGDADAFRVWLGQKDGGGMGPASVARQFKSAHTIFARGVRWGFMATNPFEGIKAGVAVNIGRKVYVSRDTINAVLAQIPADKLEFRAVVILSRFAGLRCPSEHLSLKLTDIDFDRRLLRVYAPKTGQTRLVPMFGEVYDVLLALHTAAEVGQVYVIERARTDGMDTNWRTQFERYIERAGIVPWPKLFHGLRASFETDLAQNEPVHVFAAITGHTAKIALQHYTVVQQSDFDRVLAHNDVLQKALREATKPDQFTPKPTTGAGVQPAENGPIVPVVARRKSRNSKNLGRAGIEPATQGFSILCSTS